MQSCQLASTQGCVSWYKYKTSATEACLKWAALITSIFVLFSSQGYAVGIVHFCISTPATAAEADAAKSASEQDLPWGAARCCSAASLTDATRSAQEPYDDQWIPGAADYQGHHGRKPVLVCQRPQEYTLCLCWTVTANPTLGEMWVVFCTNETVTEPNAVQDPWAEFQSSVLKQSAQEGDEVQHATAGWGAVPVYVLVGNIFSLSSVQVSGETNSRSLKMCSYCRIQHCSQHALVRAFEIITSASQ